MAISIGMDGVVTRDVPVCSVFISRDSMKPSLVKMARSASLVCMTTWTCRSMPPCPMFPALSILPSPAPVISHALWPFTVVSFSTLYRAIRLTLSRKAEVVSEYEVVSVQTRPTRSGCCGSRTKKSFSGLCILTSIATSSGSLGVLRTMRPPRASISMSNDSPWRDPVAGDISPIGDFIVSFDMCKVTLTLSLVRNRNVVAPSPSISVFIGPIGVSAVLTTFVIS